MRRICRWAADATPRPRLPGDDPRLPDASGSRGADLAATHESVLRTVGQGFAVAAGIAAGWAFVPRTGGTINPSTLQEFYLDQPELATRLTLLATRVDLYRADEEFLKRKFRRLLVSMGLLLLAAVAVFAGFILDVS